jgi:hypothetical protein
MLYPSGVLAKKPRCTNKNRMEKQSGKIYNGCGSKPKA